MRYYMQTSDGYISGIGTGDGGMEITKSEYDEIMSLVRNRPSREGYEYRLKTDLTWEEFPVEPPEPSEDIDPAEMADALEEIL